ncbi:bacterio-opsin activator domain-containing protein [Haloarcula litorea]|uniref:bacterio-opsin activator domain-containing protein n=1 Tax=Haloarcula litorea TaxID=3032579 RepID=UPI0023E85AA3|nr:bacterio-opsin activator domain-containing protein [Halomicroarcula sp. GDY20]
MDERLARAPVGVIEVDGDGTVVDLNDRARAVCEVAEAAAGGRAVTAVFPRSVEGTLQRVFDGSDGVPAREFEEYYPDPDRWLDVSVVPTDGGATVYVADVSERHERAQTVDRLRTELDRVELLGDLVADVLSELVGATSRGEIAETICARLGESDAYAFAWVGDRELGGDGLAVRAAAGESTSTLDRVREVLAEPATTPEERAVERGEPVVARPLASTDTVPDAVRRAAFADGIQSMLAIPLTHGETVYGVVAVYATEREAFAERERVSFETLGSVAGFAVNAARQRTLLAADRVVELVLDLPPTAGPLGAVAGARDADLTVTGTVPGGGAETVCYLTVDGDTASAAADALREDDAVAAARVVASGEGGSIEVTLTGATPLTVALDRGATVESATFGADGGRLTLHLSPDGTVRRFAEGIARRFDADVVAKRETSRQVERDRRLAERVNDRLTERQEAALRAAYHADYFESPRGSTAEEVAGSLDITGPTLLYHLRAAQRTLLDAYFADSPP